MSEQENKFKKLNELIGSNSKIEENPKSAQKKDEMFFLTLIDNLCQIEAASAVLRTVGIHAEKYDNPFYQAIEMLMIKHYGHLKASIILWWAFDSITPDGDLYPLVDENDVKHMIKTPSQLYKFIKRYDGK
jgi:hypothetical protein